MIDKDKFEFLHEFGENIVGRNFDLIKKYLLEYKFNRRLGVFNDINSVITWIEKITKQNKLKKWNVVLAGKANNTDLIRNSPVGPVNKIRRTRKIQKTKQIL